MGDVVSVCANENVGYWHQAHSFVRGNWRNSDQTSPMILQKCCHDMDIYTWLLGKKCKAISSVGDTHLFKKGVRTGGRNAVLPRRLQSEGKLQVRRREDLHHEPRNGHPQRQYVDGGRCLRREPHRRAHL
ncbi:MAG: Gfo/Idh/MocA family oxidoreductase [Hominenteromicrobium sp.]|uniref:Gfo/Idh/MocA family oxidoreductase n=1 Tax=Hominenteromicrobium sp. TaxID=3073581 RepID=UPI0039A32FEC